MSESLTSKDIQMDPAAMYREDVFTDNAVGTLRRLTPVLADGSEDKSRPTLFVGSTQVLTNAGPLPLNFEIEAKDIASAITAFGKAARDAFETTMEELRELQRRQASSIVVPRGTGGLPGAGGLPGGKIQIP